MQKPQCNKALFFVNSLHGGGAEKTVLTLCEALHKKNIESVVVTLYPRKDFVVPNYIEEWNLGFKDSNLKITSYWTIANIKNILRKNRIWKDFTDKYSETKFKLITAHLMTSKLVVAASPFKNEAIFVNHTGNNIFNKWEQIIYKQKFNKYYFDKKQVFVSKNLLDNYKKHFNCTDKLLRTIYNPVNVDSNNKNILHRRPYILFLGRLEKEKNPIKLLDLYSKGNFKDKYDLVYVGEGRLRKKLESKIKKLKLQNNVFVKGFTSNANDWTKQASLLASTSLFEGLPLNIIEALMLSTPVVCYDCPTGPSEILTGSLSNYLVPVNSNDEIFINKMWDALNKNYPKVTKEFFDKFSSDKIIKKYIEFYQAI